MLGQIAKFLTVLTLVLLITYSILIFGLFDLLGVPTMTPGFADIGLITSFASCSLENYEVKAGVSCDKWGRPFNYPLVWIEIFRWLGLYEAATFKLGIGLIFLFSLASLHWFYFCFGKQSSWFSYLIFSLLLLSPPTLLLLERGNSDILILIILTLAFTLIQKEKFLAAAACLFVATILKVYPVAALMFLIVKTSKLYWKWFFTITTLGAVSLLVSDMPHMLQFSWLTWSPNMFGMMTLPSFFLQTTLGSSWGTESSVIGLATLLLMVMVCSKYGGVLQFRYGMSDKIYYDGHKNFLLYWGFLFVGIYGLTSFDLRLPFLMPLAFMYISKQCNYVLQCKISFFFVLIFYLSYGINILVLNLLGDLLLLFFVSFLIVDLFKLNPLLQTPVNLKQLFPKSQFPVWFSKYGKK